MQDGGAVLVPSIRLHRLGSQCREKRRGGLDLGPWEELENPCEGEGADLTYGTQSTYLFALPGSGSMIAMFDEWKKEDLRDSRYLWLPAEIDMGRMRVKLE